MEHFTKENQRFYIYVEWKNGSNAAEIREKLVNAGGLGVLTLSTIRRWIYTFNHGKLEINDEPRSGRPREAITAVTINKVKNIINKDPHVFT